MEGGEAGIVRSYEAAFGNKKVEQKPISKSVDESWAPAKDSNWMDNLKSCAKSVILFGGLSFLIFYWKEAGLMASSVAVPTMCICTAFAGYGVGKNAMRK